MTRTRLIVGALAAVLVGAGVFAARNFAGSTANAISASDSVVPTAESPAGRSSSRST
jgi:hypothetical protein